MSRVCACCGQDVDGIPRYFMSRLPDSYVSRKDELIFDDKFTCRGVSEDHFISCEVELPFREGGEDALGFIGWVQVSASVYNAYRAYRKNEDTRPPYEDLVPGLMANPIPQAPGTSGVAVKFKVLPRDPTPYIRWVEPNTPLAALMERGATLPFWHKIAAQFSASH